MSNIMLFPQYGLNLYTRFLRIFILQFGRGIFAGFFLVVLIGYLPSGQRRFCDRTYMLTAMANSDQLGIGHRFFRLHLVPDMDSSLLFRITSRQLILLSFLLLFLLFLPLQKLIGSLSSRQQIRMQCDQIPQQKPKHPNNPSTNPPNRKLPHLPRLPLPHTPHPRMHHHHNSRHKGRNDTDHKVPIVCLAHTVIEPHTVVIEVLHATITTPTMLALQRTVAVAELAEEHLCVVRSEHHLFVELRPFVVVHHTVRRVAERRQEGRNYHRQQTDREESEQYGVWRESVDAGVIDRYGKGHHEVGRELCGGRTARKAVCGVLRSRVVGGRMAVELQFLFHVRFSFGLIHQL